MPVLRTVFVIGLALMLARGALGLPIISDVWSSTLSGACPANGRGALVTDYSYLSWEGRTLSLSELGGTYTPFPCVSLGAAYRDSAGQGLSGLSHYTAHGWEAWTSVHLLTERASRPDLSLDAQMLHDTVSLVQQSATLASSAFSNVTTRGVDLCAGKQCLAGRCQLDGGVYDVSLLGQRQATVWALGAAYQHPFSRLVTGRVALAGYRDDYEGGLRYTYDMVLGVRVGRADHPYIGLSANYFPCGIPLAGTPLSSAAMIGAFYDGASAVALRSHEFGYLSIEAGLPF